MYRIKLKTVVFAFFLFIFLVKSIAQNQPSSFIFWKLNSVSGEVGLKGFYREQELIRNDFKESQKSTFGSAWLLLKTKSYFLHPNFLILNVDAGYSPQTIRDNFLIIPDRSEVNTLKKLDTRATFFEQKKISLTAFANFNESYSNRENLSNIKTNSQNLGGMFSLSNKILPLSLTYQEEKWNELETESKHEFKYDQKSMESFISRSFGTMDRNEIHYKHNESIYRDDVLFQIQNTTDNVYLNNNLFFDKKRNYNFNSMISLMNQQGNDNFTRYQAYENFALRLPKKLYFRGNYNYFNIQRPAQNLIQNGLSVSLGHQLFESLNTNVFYEYNDNSHTVYHEIVNKAGGEINYEKKIPAKGQLSLTYKYYRQLENMESNDVVIQIKNEDYVLSDGQIVLFKKPYVDINSIIVKDATGTIIYQLNFDYLLIPRENFLEIQRVPGGKIANSLTVFIDYTAIQPGAYQFDLNFNYFSSSISFFKRLIELYYHTFKQDYSNLKKTEFLTLNYFTQNVYGGRLEYKFVSGGIEYDDYNSIIVPYKMWRYYLILQGNFKTKLSCSLNGNISDYQMILNDTLKQKYFDLSGNLIYNFNPKTKISFTTSYRNQQGKGVELDLFTSRTEFTSIFHQLIFTIGLEMYNRDYLGEIMNFKGVNIQVVRKF